VHVRRAVCGLRGPALMSDKRAGDLPVLVHVVSQRARVLRLTQDRTATRDLRAAVVLPFPPTRNGSRHPDLRGFFAAQ